MQFYVYFSVLWKLTINDVKRKRQTIGLYSHSQFSYMLLTALWFTDACRK